MRIKIEHPQPIDINAGPFGYCIHPVKIPAINGGDRYYFGIEDLQPVISLRKNFLISDGFGSEPELENARLNGFEVRGDDDEMFVRAAVDMLLADGVATLVE